MNFGQIYSTIDRLVKDGLVVGAAEGREGVERKVYRITPKGKEEFKNWLDRPSAKVRPLRDEIFVKMAFMYPLDKEAIVHLLGESIARRSFASLTTKIK